MVVTNRDLAAMRDVIDYELYRLTVLKNGVAEAAARAEVVTEICELQRERLAICAAIVNRRIEASRRVVSFSRWTSGNGVLDRLLPAHRHAARDAGYEDAASPGSA